MDAFMKLAGQLFLIICIQSVLDAMVSSWRQNHFQKVISLACYIASLLLVINFMYKYFFQTLTQLVHTYF